MTITDEIVTELMIETPPPKPQCYNISLPIFVNVIGISDRDNCVSAQDQMKQRPFEMIDLDVDKFMEEYSAKTEVKERSIHPVDQEEDTVDIEFVDEEIVKSVIEQIAGDAVFCDYFRETVKNLKRAPGPLYSQIKLDILTRKEKRREEIRKMITRPKRSDVNKMCDELLVDSLHSTFRLGPVNRPKDM